MATVTTDQVRAYEDGWNRGLFSSSKLDREWYMRRLTVDEQFKPVLEESWKSGWMDRIDHRPKWHSLECFKDDHSECN